MLPNVKGFQVLKNMSQANRAKKRASFRASRKPFVPGKTVNRAQALRNFRRTPKFVGDAPKFVGLSITQKIFKPGPSSGTAWNNSWKPWNNSPIYTSQTNSKRRALLG